MLGQRERGTWSIVLLAVRSPPHDLWSSPPSTNPGNLGMTAYTVTMTWQMAKAVALQLAPTKGPENELKSAKGG
jgi:hypothetical protein